MAISMAKWQSATNNEINSESISKWRNQIIGGEGN